MCDSCKGKIARRVKNDYQSIIARIDAEKAAGTATQNTESVHADANGSQEPVGNDAGSKKVTVNDIVRFANSWIQKSDEFSPEQKKAARAMAECKTAELGGFVQYCPDCKKFVGYQYCSCGNRCCSLCQYPMQKKWVELRKSEIIPGVPYYHAVQTLPHELNDLFLANRREISSLMFHCFSETILKICEEPKVLGAKPGIISVQHTWNSMMELHLHVHGLVTGGGLDPDGKFINLIDLRNAQKKAGTVTQQAASEQKQEDKELFFFSMRQASSLFRGKFMSGLKELYTKRKLVIPASRDDLNNPNEWSVFCYKLDHMDWVGNINQTLGGDRIFHYVKKSPLEGVKLSVSDIDSTSDPDMDDDVDWDSAESCVPRGDAFDYLGRYIFRTAMNNHRISSFDADSKTVSFLCRDNDHPGQKKTVILNIYEFVRRLLMHIPPKGLTRVRFSGFLSCPHKTKNLISIFQQLGLQYEPSPLKDAHGVQLLMLLFPNADYGKCPFCKGTVEVYPFGERNLKLPRGKPTADK